MKRRHFALLIAACLMQPAVARADPVRNEAIAREAIEQALGAGRFDLLPRLFAESYVFHGEDRDYALGEVEANMRGLRAAFPDLTARVERSTASGDLVSIHWRGEGTNSVRTGSFPGTGRRVRFEGMAFIRFQGGRMVEEWSVYDSLALLRQLGPAPAPAP